MTSLVVISSDPVFRSEIGSLILKCDPGCEVIGTADSIEAAKKFMADAKPDALFMDIELSDGPAFEFIDGLPKNMLQLVLMSGTPDAAYKAFEYNAVDFLLKPLRPEHVKRALEKLRRGQPYDSMSRQLQLLLRSTQHKPIDRLILHLSEGIHILPLNETIRLESDGCYTSFFTSSGERIVVTRAIGEFDHLTENGPFFRVHQSHIVNLNFVRKVLKEDGGFVVLDTGVKVPIARRRKDEFFQTVLRHSAA